MYQNKVKKQWRKLLYMLISGNRACPRTELHGSYELYCASSFQLTSLFHTAVLWRWLAFSSPFAVTNMCSSDNYFSNFIYLDVHNASLYYLQSCVCTLHVLFSGTLYFVPIRTPQPDCGSVIHVTSNDGNQIHAFKCNGTTTFSVKTNDRISISVHNLGQLAYDTAYCYVVSLGRYVWCTCIPNYDF